MAVGGDRLGLSLYIAGAFWENYTSKCEPSDAVDNLGGIGHGCVQRRGCVRRLFFEARQRGRKIVSVVLVLCWADCLWVDGRGLGVCDETPEAGDDWGCLFGV